ENVHGGACVWLVERLPYIMAAVKEARLDFGRQVVRLVFDPLQVKLSDIARQFARLGYPPHPARGRNERELRKREDRTHVIRIAIAGAIAGNVMIISFALYGGMFHGMEPIYERLFHWVSLLLMAVSVLGPGRVFFRGAMAALRAGVMHMDVPVSIGLAAGSLWSAVNAIRGSSEIYFDSLSILVFLLLLGRWIQLRQQRKSRDAVELLFSMTPGSARLVEGDDVREVPIEAIQPMQIVEVRAGETIPVDGVVEHGLSMINASFLTGESKPVRVKAGDRVHAGAVNLSSKLCIKAESIGEQTRVGKLMRLVEESASRRAPVVRLADRIAGIFVVAVLMLAALTFGLWVWLDPNQAMPNAMALLIITCPCALGLATPLAIIAGIGRAARGGMLIRGGEVVEQINRPGLLLLDKTGTLTIGSMRVTEWHGPDHLKQIVGAIESHSSHPLAAAMSGAFGDSQSANVTNVKETTGFGIEGVVDGERVLIGSRRFMMAQGIVIPFRFAALQDEMGARAATPVLVALGSEVQAVVGIGDPIKSDAHAAIRRLRCAGWNVGILSGDHPAVVAAVARELGMDSSMCHGAVSPEEKLAFVKQSLMHGPVMMVGDGVNDAAALAAASVGVAVKGGAEASFAAADVYLDRPGLTPLAELVEGSRRTFGVIRRNIAVSLLYNVLGVSLAVAGLLNPLIAAIIMPISSLTVIVLSYRSRTFEESGSCP
ncbi:MAG TPA: cation-translocating P-type ATPase, partial [Phycisphaerales bacterium]|nr:cation-translocating P-type ATPase [Phycisphaerales bacterium]